MAQEVMLYHSGQTGAPSATLVALGGLIALLDACLVNGYNVNTVTALTRSGTTVTATTSGTNGFAVGEWVDVAGANETEYNGRVKVTGKPAVNQFTYTIATTPASPATGTITAKYGAAGWTKPFAGTNTAVYTTGSGSLGHSMQVEDNNPYADSNVSVRTRIVLGANGIPDSGLQLGEQCRQAKANGGWVLIADKKTCYIVFAAATTFVFGEATSFLVGDLYSFFQSRGLTASGSFYNSTAGVTTANIGSYVPLTVPAADSAQIATQAPVTWARAADQLFANGYGSPVTPDHYGASAAGAPVGHSNAQAITIPNAADNSLPLFPLFLCDRSATAHTLRARMRGAYWPIGQLPSNLFANNVSVLDDVVINGALRKIAVVRCGVSSGHQLAFDMGAAW